MSAKRLRKQIIRKKLFNKNRLVILNEDTFEEIFSLRLNLMNVFVWLTSVSIIMIALTTYIIAFTPLREYIPGYASTKLKQQATENALKSDSLVKALEDEKIYLASIKKVLTGELDKAMLSRDSIAPSDQKELTDDEMKPNEADQKLRQQVAHEDKYNLFEKATPRVSQVLFAPVRGTVTRPYNAVKKQFFIEIAVANNTPVKAIAAGTVVLADWTPTNGNVMVVRHNDGIISVYKQMAELTKEQGDLVKSGEVVALAGVSDKSGGAMLHFELWKDGYPINPTQFIDFE